MRKVLIGGLLFLLMAGSVMSAENSCPADRAGKQGHNPIAEFHHVLAPVWHQSWPAKDYDALLKAGPQFAERFDEIEAMNPEFNTEKKQETFLKYRKQFGMLVDAFAVACEAGDKEKAYELMPDLHDAFEMTASALLPTHYPEFEGVVISSNLLVESHLPADNIDGIKGTTETLVAKINNLTEETIPEELLEKKAEILAKFAEMKKLVAKLQECCVKDDTAGIKKTAIELSKKIDSFALTYI